MAPRPDEPDDGVQPPGADVPPPSDGTPDHVGPSDDEAWAEIVAQLSDLDGYDGAEDPPEPEKAPSPGPSTEPTAGLTFPVAPWVAETRVVQPAPGPADEPVATGRDWDGTSQYDEAE